MIVSPFSGNLVRNISRAALFATTGGIPLTYAFCWFGKIRPLLDRNGHIQRALFAAMAIEFGFPLSPRFAIHPRPYDRLLATALELFTCSPAGEENGKIGLVAEYLGFFLDGPFEGTRKNCRPLRTLDLRPGVRVPRAHLAWLTGRTTGGRLVKEVMLERAEQLGT